MRWMVWLLAWSLTCMAPQFSLAIDPPALANAPRSSDEVPATGAASQGTNQDIVVPLADELKKIVEQQAVSWNRGDIDDYMQAYWQNEGLTFSSGGEVERGWTATRDRYRRRYPDRKTMGRLKFSELEVQPLDEHVALMLGRWRLEREQPIGGNFSLVWKKIDGRWLIIHDHTSVKNP